MGAACCGSSLARLARLAATTAASAASAAPSPVWASWAAATASCTAVCTIAITRTAGGVPILAWTINSPATVFQSVTASARAWGARAAKQAAATQAIENLSVEFMVLVPSGLAAGDHDLEVVACDHDAG